MEKWIKNTSEPQWKIWTWGTLALIAAILSFYMFYILDWNEVKLATASRLKLSQLYNIVILWCTIILFDMAYPGRTLAKLNRPLSSLEFLGSCIFYGCMALATSFVLVWGN